MLFAEDPADVRPPKPALNRRVNVLLLIGKAMVPPMVRGPPERAFLHGSSANEREAELKEAIDAVASVGKVAVIANGDSENPDQIGDRTETDQPWAERNKENGQNRNMNEQEREAMHHVLGCHGR